MPRPLREMPHNITNLHGKITLGQIQEITRLFSVLKIGIKEQLTYLTGVISVEALTCDAASCLIRKLRSIFDNLKNKKVT